MKTIIATVGAVMTAVTLGAQEADEKAVEVEEEETPIFEAGFDFDFNSAYVWRNAVQTDRMVMQPCVWADFTLLDPFYFGFNIWQNYDLTRRRRPALTRGLTETDYNVHVGYTAWTSDDEEMSLTFELGHEWYVNQFLQDDEATRQSYPSTRELYLKVMFDNPFVGVYGQASWMYGNFGDYRQGMHYELGFNKEVELIEETLTLGADWNVNFGDHRYLSYLYGGVSDPYFEYDEEAEEGYPADDYDDGSKGVVGGTTVKLYLTWAITDWLSLKGTVAYTGLLNGALRESTGEQGGDYWFCGVEGAEYPRDLLWGGLSLNVEF